MECPSAELLPDAEKEQTETYKKVKESAQIHGQNFEYKFCALVFLRATNKGYKFKLASNVEGLGAFDDVVVKYLDATSRKSHIFLQLKSKTSKHITMKQLLSEKGDFSLRKYYESYLQIEKKFKSSEKEGDERMFIIYTNTDVVQELKCNKGTEVGEEGFLMTGCSVLQFDEEEHKAIYEHLQELPKHREFLSRFRIFYCQADEKEMNCHIKSELQQNMELPDNEMELAYMFFRDFMKDWWQNSNFFLKETNCKENDPLRKTSEEVRTTLVAKILEQRKCELDELRIKYKESAITDMKQLIQPHKAVLIFAPGRSTTLTAAKIHQMLSATTHIILNLQQLVRYKTEVMLAWKHSFNVMVLEGDSFVNDFQNFANEISIILNEYDVEKKIIFVSGRLGNIQQISALRQTFSTILTEEHDHWRVTDIITESRTFFLEKYIIFQGSEMQIKNLVKERDVRMLNALDCDSISLLLGNEKPCIGVPIESTLEYYIDRTLRCVKYIKTGIQNESEVLVPSRGESLEELQGISVCGERNWKSSNYEQAIPQLSLANEDEKDSRTLCNETTNLQGLCTEEESRLLRQNIDEFGNAHRHLERETTTVWRPTTLLDGDARIILLTDEPGMGKSTLLSHLAKQTQERHPDTWIVRVNINNYTNILHEIQTNGFDEKGVLKLLAQAAQIKEKDGVQLEKQLFNYVYNSTGNMAVMIDGVDEVSPHYTEEVIQILRILLKTKIRKVWVTSRNSVKDQLEQEFQCQSYSLTPFSLEDQKSFLVKFWNQKYSYRKGEYLETLANRVFEVSIKHLSVKEKDFMGVPLQTMLLAEVFGENLKQYSTSATVQLPENLNLVMLYDLYVKKIWDILLSDKKVSDRTNVNVLTDDDALYDIFIDNHKAAALMAILSTNHLEKLNDKNLLKKCEYFLHKINQGMEKTGIITDVIEGRPVFQHRTLAEYFVAKWLCDNFLASQIFMRDHIFQSGFRVIRSMVDRILANKCPLHEAVLNSNTRYVAKMLKRNKTVTQKDRGGRTPLHVAVSCRKPEIVRLLLGHGADVSSADTFLGFSAIQYAIRMVDWEMLSLMMEKRPEIREQVLNGINHFRMEPTDSVISAQVKFIHTDLLRYLISRENCVNIILRYDYGTLFHEAAMVEVAKFMIECQEMSYEEYVFECIVLLHKALTNLNRLNVSITKGNTPLHFAAVAGKPKLLYYLLSAGSDLRSCNVRGEYPLTLAARYGRNDNVELLLQRHCVVKCEDIMTSALQAAIVAGHVDTSALLLRSGAPVSGGENEKPIHAASRLGHMDIVSLLLQHGASLNCRTDSGNTALHLASEAGHLSLVKYLVEREGEDVNILNYDNETTLHLAAQKERKYLVKYFVENGCSINGISANSSTCLHVACENVHYTTVEYLLKHGAKVNAMNSADRTPLHIAASRGQTELVGLLSLYNANFSLRDTDGITALLAASRNGHLDTMRFIVQHGGNIEDTDGKGNTIAHFAVANDNHDILKFLSKQDANLDVQNSDGDTPLLQAVREGRNRIIQYLVEKNSDINTQGNDGMRPLDVAVLKGNMEITGVLLERNASSCKAGMHIIAAARFGFLDLLQGFVATGEDINVKTENGESPLHVACKSGQVATVQYLSEHGALLDLQDNSGNTALHVAVSNGHLDTTRDLVEKGRHVEVVRELLKYGASVNISDNKGGTPLNIASFNGHLDVVRELLNHCISVNTANKNGWTPLYAAALKGHVGVVRELLDHGAIVDIANIERYTPLYTAASKGHVEVVRELLKQSASVDTSDEEGWTPLYAAAFFGHVEVVRELLNYGASVDIANIEGYTPLYTAASKGHMEAVLELLNHDSSLDISHKVWITLYAAALKGQVEVVREMLKQSASVDIANIYGFTPLYAAAIFGNVGVVRELLNHGASVDIANNDNWSPLYAAALLGHVEVVRELLNHGAFVDIEQNNGCTPLSQVAASGHVEIVRELLNHGASVDIADDEGDTSLHNASLNGHAEIVRELLNHCASVDIANESGCTPLNLACSNGNVEAVRELLTYSARTIMEINQWWKSFNKSASKGHLEVVRLLLNHGATVDIANNNGWTPLNIAALNGSLEIIRDLLNHGANVDISNTSGWTSLNIAASNGHLEIVRELLNHGASVNIANDKGWTPLREAALKDHVEVVQELQKHGAM